jgi:Acetoacetate decarboxylase (ADC)
MNIDTKKVYMMPLIMGPILPEREKQVGSVYKEIQYIGLQYQTDPEAIRALLPDCYKPAKEPAVTVLFAYNDGVDFMTGRGYRVAAVNVAARFDGEVDHVDGDYCLVMFEDDAIPVLNGREMLGIHKVYANISQIISMPDGRIKGEVSLWGHQLFGIDLEPLKEQNVVVRSVAARTLNSRPLLGFKYIPSFSEVPDASYPTLVSSEFKIDRFWMGKGGEVVFGSLREEDSFLARRVVDALSTLPVVKVTQAFRLTGSTVLRSDLARRLK